MRDFSDVRYVWRHLPLSDVHVHAQPAAEAAGAAAAQDASWPMYDLLLTHQDALDHADLVGSAGRLGLDVERFAWLADLVGSAARLGMDVEGFAEDLDACLGAMRTVAEVESADRSTGTPTFFVNGRRHYGPYDIASLLAAVRAAEANGHLDSLEARKGTSPVAPMP